MGCIYLTHHREYLYPEPHSIILTVAISKGYVVTVNILLCLDPNPEHLWWNNLMKTMLAISLLLNIVVLIPVCVGLATHADGIQVSFGEATPARGILLSVYLSILAASASLLAFRDAKLTAALLLMQIIYKLTTPITVGTFYNSVVISNLVIAAFHSVTLFITWRSIGNPLK